MRASDEQPITTSGLGFLEAAASAADLRVLLMCLVHLTGDHRWLAPPYRPVRDVRLIADASAGLPSEVQQEIRAAAIEILRDGVPPPALVEPDDKLLEEMMSVCVGEQVPPEYVAMLREDMGFSSGDPRWRTPAGARRRPAPRVLVVGAGISGLCIGAKLGELGVPYTVIEKNRDIGGTWYENRYPGCAVDTPNHFYAYSFGRRHRWSRYFSPRDDIHEYLTRFADEFGVREHVRFGCEVTRAEWDPSRGWWNVSVRTSDGEEQLSAEVLVSAIGQLNQPTVPALEGLDDFGGPLVHTARWPTDLDVKGRRVAVIGTGASAMQLVPTISDQVAALTVFQRSPQWARPVGDYHRSVDAPAQWLLDQVPFYAAWHRFALFWRFGDGLLPYLKKDPSWPHPAQSLNRGNDRHREELTGYLVEELRDVPHLVERCLPTYPPYGKRMLIDNGWYRTLTRPHVELVTEPIDHLDAGAVVTADGRRHEVDVVIMATGFQVTDMAARLGIHGISGASLAESWSGDDPRAHLGVTVPGFPNLFLMYGPNTNLGHGGSIIFHAECQTRYITSCIVEMVERGIAAIDCRPEVCEAYTARLDEAHEHMIWTHPGVTTWYRNPRGRVISTSPWRLVDYWAMTHRVDLDDFELLGVPAAVS